MSRLRRRVGWRADRAPRHHHVWHSAFWTRPALLVLYGLLVAALGVAMAWDVPQSWREGSAMKAGTMCDATTDGPCLQQVTGWVEGPFYRRRGQDSWHFVTTDRPDQTFDVFELPYTQQRTLDRVDRDRTLTALVFEDEVVAVRLPGGGQVSTDSYGDSRWWTLSILTLLAAAGAAFLFQNASARRREVGGWWGVRTVDEPGRPGGWMAVAVVLLAPAVAAIAPLMVAGSLPWSVGAAVLGLAAGAVVARLVVRDRAAVPVRRSKEPSRHRAAGTP